MKTSIINGSEVSKLSVAIHFCILPTEFKFKTGQEYLTQIEVNIRTNGEDKKSTRKAYVSTFQVVQKGDSFNIIQTAHK
ncbi:putative T6SS immunity periplasmic lipoprotein [Pantoea dispersa]|uniref:putative T6SS immunity periplasmic lipoprotein n=1 Tax=Pantoea dispersa TaxID=59814 RepID=UPI003D28C29D